MVGANVVFVGWGSIPNMVVSPLRAAGLVLTAVLESTVVFP